MPGEAGFELVSNKHGLSLKIANQYTCPDMKNYRATMVRSCICWKFREKIEAFVARLQFVSSKKLEKESTRSISHDRGYRIL